MIFYVHLQGGMGNQMFQYAAALSALKEHPEFENFKIDTSFYGGQERKVIKKGLTGRGYDLNLFNVDRELEDAPEGAVILEGWFQNFNEFKVVEDEVRKQFEFKIQFDPHIEEKRQEILSQENSVSIHVRRGDFINNPTAFKHNHHMGPDYYQKSMEILESKYNRLTYYVFSEDTEWCRQNIKNDKHEVVYIDGTYDGQQDAGHMYLMRSCNNHIIANSTYSWWSAFLSDTNNVIGPSKWFTNGTGSDIMLDNWITI